jgi:hypothetical protein
MSVFLVPFCVPAVQCGVVSVVFGMLCPSLLVLGGMSLVVVLGAGTDGGLGRHVVYLEGRVFRLRIRGCERVVGTARAAGRIIVYLGAVTVAACSDDWVGCEGPLVVRRDRAVWDWHDIGLCGHRLDLRWSL